MRIYHWTRSNNLGRLGVITLGLPNMCAWLSGRAHPVTHIINLDSHTAVM